MIGEEVKSLLSSVRSRINWRLFTITIIQNMKRIILFLSIVVITVLATIFAATKTGLVATAQNNTGNTTMVSLLSDKAIPDIVTTSIGNYVQFNSKDGEPHIIAQGAGDAYGQNHDHELGGLESNKFGSDEGYKVLFKKVGIYDFHDHLHPKIHITVIVKTK